MVPSDLGNVRLLEVVPDQTLPTESLLELTDDREKAEVGRHGSGLERRVAEAWTMPMADLSCGQCRMLVGQKFGLSWLARPVTTFVARYPRAECDLYAGDMTVIALVRWRELSAFDEAGVRKILVLDLDWLRREADRDDERGIVRQAAIALDEALRIFSTA